MIKNLCLLFSVLILVAFQLPAEARGRSYHGPQPYPQPYPYYPTHPYPAYPQPYQVTCYAQGLANGVMFYGVGPDIYTANRWALYTCHSSGQYCQSLGCR